jgi:4-carboxymuconolactone decarboxylase
MIGGRVLAGDGADETLSNRYSHAVNPCCRRCPSGGAAADHLLTAREWRQDYEWSVHYPIALKAGIRKELADDIAVGRRPSAMSPDEETVFDFTSELLRSKQVSDATFERAKSRLGTKGVVDMTGIVGYYTFLAMQLNVAQYPVAGDGKKPPQVPR